MSASGNGSGRGPTPHSRYNTSKDYNMARRERFLTLCLSRPGGAQPVPMSEEGEGVEHIMVTLTRDAMARAAEKLNLGPEGELMDHDGVKLKINAS